MRARIEEKEKESKNIERTILEANELAEEIKQKAALEAGRILMDAEAKVALSKTRITLIEEEILQVKEELSFYQRLVCDDPTNESTGKTVITCTGAMGQRGGIIPAEQAEGFLVDSSAYTIQLVSFLNARHYVVFGEKQGPVHAHSWQVHIKIKIPAEKSEQIPFANIMEAINSVITCYEKTVLNEQYPFNIVQPTTENMAMVFFNRFEDIFRDFGLVLGNLAVWETPTKGIEVTRRNPEFDNIPVAAEQEIAATKDNITDNTDDKEKRVSSQRDKRRKQTAKRAAQPDETLNAGLTSYDYPAYRYALHALLIMLIAFIAYYQIITPQFRLHYPWGSDTWGHLFKAEFLFQQIMQGDFFPQFTEYWYNGAQPFRYWAPLPYYMIALLRFFSTDIFMAGNYYVFGCALLGGLSLLFFARRIGIWPATLAGIIWSVWIDNVRVAFSEGNLPRVLATALLPLLFILYLKILEERKISLTVVLTVLLIHVVILCHAMIGAVYCICLALFALFFWAFGGCRLRDLLRGFFIVFVGIISAGWWLLPSLSGGITVINPEAVRAVVQFVPSAISLNPFNRFSDRETFYWGVSLLFAIGVTCLGWRTRLPWVKSLAICGVVLVIITFPSARLFFLLMPLSHLLWPLRFSSFAALALIISSMAFSPSIERFSLSAGSLKKVVIICLLAFLFLIDCFFSVRLLAFTRAKSYILLEGTEYLKAAPGWRIATVDLSRLGSAPSFLFSETAGREQVFGWAWQGATTSQNIMLLNMGLEYQYYPFLFRSCVLLGATDLLVKNDVIEEPQIFAEMAGKAAYEHIVNIDEISLWHGAIDFPYLVVKNNDALVIGRHAGTIAIQFPNVEMGTSPYLDRYSLDDLIKYPKIILSGTEWWAKTKAEQLIRNYISAGGEVFVELSGLPENVLAKQPEFLGVYGETVTLRGQLELFDNSGKSFLLKPFAPKDFELWKTYVPQGLDAEELYFDYYGVKAPVLGYKLVEGHKVWFLGGNLSYHTFLTKDPQALQIIEEIFGLEREYFCEELIPLDAYQATESGYVMKYSIDRDVNVVVPVAALDGIKVEIDGHAWPYTTFENLLRMDLPAGEHEITIVLERTPVYLWGSILSLLSPLMLVGGLIFLKRLDKDVKRNEQISS
ncbi:MAG: 6-pyruvoyl-tetrahydropterin synthase-related protein [Bacillota bacterium]